MTDWLSEALVLLRLGNNEIISRDVSKSQPMEGFVEVEKTKRLLRCLEIIEGIILPIILLIFTLIYWAYAFALYTSAEE